MIPFYTIVTDLEILTKDTLKVTVGKKNIAYAFTTADRRFFPMMNKDGRDRKGKIRFAPTQFIRETVRMAVSWAQSAIIKFFEICLKVGEIQDGMILFSLFLTGF